MCGCDALCTASRHSTHVGGSTAAARGAGRVTGVDMESGLHVVTALYTREMHFTDSEAVPPEQAEAMLAQMIQFRDALRQAGYWCAGDPTLECVSYDWLIGPFGYYTWSGDAWLSLLIKWHRWRLSIDPRVRIGIGYYQ